MIDLKNVAIPLPFQARISPFATVIEDLNRHWARKIQLTATEAAAERFDRAQVGYGASCVYPCADMDSLLICAHWMTWLLAIDDQHGGGVRRTPGARQAERSRLEAVLNGAVPSNPAGRGLADLIQRTSPRMSAGWHRRFVSHIKEVWEGYQMESIQRSAGVSAEPDDFIRIRRYTGPVPFCIDLAELSVGTEVPAAIYGLPDFQDLRLAANDVISWVNDVYSVNRELARGGHDNYLIALMQHRDMSAEQALHEVIDQITERAANFLTAERKLRLSISSLPAGLQKATWTNATAMRDWMAGQISWYKATNRLPTAPAALPAGQDVREAV